MPADPPILGQKYRLLRQLEAGGMGSVWLAEHVHLNALVAVKLMGREVAATPAGTERFLREARTAASLRSPHVVQILDYGVHEGVPFIAMELLEGETLAARLEREGRFASWERAELVLRHVARAVGRAHDAGIIHRDLKPANIFLVRDEEEEIVKLLDFGIAKTTAALLSAAPGSGTRTGEFLGSPTYASPEQLQVSKTLDHRADIWSLGVLAYECLIGRPPFTAETLVGLVLEICSHPLPIPSEHGPVPAGFDAWFARACARDVNRRFQSARDASGELRRLVAAACGSRWPLSEAESDAAVELRSLPLSLPESALAVQTPASTPTLLERGFAALAAAPGDTLVLQRSRAQRAGGSLPAGHPVRRRSTLTLIAALTLLAVVPLLLVALRAPARALLDRGGLGLGAATASEPAQQSEAAPSEPAQQSEPAPRVEPAPPVEAALPVEPARNVEPALPVEPARNVEPAPPVEAALPVEPARNAEPLHEDEPAPAPRAVAAAPSEPAQGPPSSATGTVLPPESPSAVLPPEPSSVDRARATRGRAALARPNTAWLTFTASAASTVWLDGHALGSTPLEDVAIESGRHEVTFVHDAERSAQTVTLRAGEHKRVAARLAPAAAGGLDEAAVQRTLRDYGPSVRDICWERALSTRAPGDPTMVRVSAAITVEPSGRVQSVVTSGAPAAYPELPRCIEEKVRAWTFPSALGETVVNVPFVFVAE